ncbi:hypothetical protein HDU76_010121, partial [Blyttiomyces sp. JEL0837]
MAPSTTRRNTKSAKHNGQKTTSISMVKVFTIVAVLMALFAIPIFAFPARDRRVLGLVARAPVPKITTT